MVFYVADTSWSWSNVQRGFLDCAVDDPLASLPYADPTSIELRAPEKEHAHSLGHGYPIELPKSAYKAQWLAKEPEHQLPDIASVRGEIIVSEKFKTLVERLEPGVHQFVPIDISRGPNERPYTRYFALNVYNRIDSTDVASMESEGWFWRPDYTGARSHWRKKGDGPRYPIVFNLNQIAGRHIWVDTYLSPYGNFYASNAFVETARSEGITGLQLVEHKEV